MRKLYIPASALLAFSYPFTTVWLLEAGLPFNDLNLVNFAIKGVITIMFGVGLMAAVGQRRALPFNLFPLLLLFAFYALRLLNDVVSLDILPPQGSKTYILLYFFGLTLLPAVSIAFSFDREDIPIIHRWFLWMLILTNISLLYYVLAVGDLATDNALAYRFEVRGQEDATAILNPITVGLMGALLGLFVLGRLAAFPRMTLWSQMAQLSMLGIGLANLLLGGSRGPIVAFALGLVFVGASAFQGLGNRLAFQIRPRVLFYASAMVVAFSVVALGSDLSIAAFDRFRDMFDSGGSRIVEGRDYIAAAAWHDFSQSPLIGYSYLTMQGTALAHNVFIECFMALGIFGGLTYFVCLFFIVRGIWVGVTGGHGPFGYSLALAAVGLMALSMTSGSIGQSPEIWVMVALAMSMSRIEKRPELPSAWTRNARPLKMT
jgi:hypothetical protein